MSDKSRDLNTALLIVDTLKKLTEQEARMLFRGELEKIHPNWREMVRAFWGFSPENLKKRGNLTDLRWAEETFIKNFSKLTPEVANTNLQVEAASKFLAENLPEGFIKLVGSSPSVLAEILTDHLGWGIYVKNLIYSGGFNWRSETIDPIWPIVLVESLKIIDEDEEIQRIRGETEKDERRFLEIFTYAKRRGEYQTKDLWPKMEIDDLDLDSMLEKIMPFSLQKEKKNRS